MYTDAVHDTTCTCCTCMHCSR